MVSYTVRNLGNVKASLDQYGLREALISYGFVLTALYWHGIAGAGTSPRWSFLIVATPLLLFFYKPVKFTELHLIGLLFVALASLSWFWSFNQYDTVGALLRLLILVPVFMLGTRLKSLK